MPEGIPNRLPALLWLAIEHGWDVDLRPEPDLGLLIVRFTGLRDEMELAWEYRRLVSCELLGRPRWDRTRERSTRILLRDVPSILRGGGS